MRINRLVIRSAPWSVLICLIIIVSRVSLLLLIFIRILSISKAIIDCGSIKAHVYLVISHCEVRHTHLHHIIAEWAFFLLLKLFFEELLLSLYLFFQSLKCLVQFLIQFIKLIVTFNYLVILLSCIIVLFLQEMYPLIEDFDWFLKFLRIR